MVPLRQGQFAHIRVPGSERYEAILLPETAIVTDQSQKIALVVAEDGTVGVENFARWARLRRHADHPRRFVA